MEKKIRQEILIRLKNKLRKNQREIIFYEK